MTSTFTAGMCLTDSFTTLSVTRNRKYPKPLTYLSITFTNVSKYTTLITQPIFGNRQRWQGLVIGLLGNT